MTAEPLFPDDGLRVGPPAEAVDERTAGQKLRDRQQARIAAGLHPLSFGGAYLKLHPDAPHDAYRGDDRAYPTCGGCVHRVLQLHHDKTYPKCDVGARDTSSNASDVKAWWPGCVDHEPLPGGP